jgi:uncharacterized protein (DUF2235 family)
MPEPGAITRIGKKISQVVGLAFGGGIFRDVEQAYTYLMDIWEPGDRVFLVGFSRGAYAARLLAAVLHQLGLLPRGNHNLAPYVIRLFRALSDDGAAAATHFKLAAQFQYAFARVAADDQDQRKFPVHFLGLWDTVSSVGWVWDPPAYPYTAKNPSVGIIRHAIAIDERRAFFRQNRMFRANSAQDFEERWFPGVHSDIGGGYSTSDGGLWQRPFSWILDEASRAGLSFDDRRIQSILSPEGRCVDTKHESLTWKWWLAEFFPKLRYREGTKRRMPSLNSGRFRSVAAGALIDQWALQRLREDLSYRPANLSPTFVRSVLALPSVPSVLAYAD